MGAAAALGAGAVQASPEVEKLIAETPPRQATVIQRDDHSTHTTQVTIQQLPGEDGEALAMRVADEIERRDRRRRREALHDGVG
uniref:Uncharacterized protein n=1 Tax=Candidatus Kentrum sp. DK TaxID=2126562 RepID=A0A450SY55_9GAMM|nr:MAG: hypothetical protein BECKDK2373B_GA0170837_108016 [Candidatus Kentron sp. DK]